MRRVDAAAPARARWTLHARRAPGARPAPARVLLAFDSFGGFLSAPEATTRVAARLRQHGLLAVPHPLSDGGEGLLEALRHHGPLLRREVVVRDALGRPRRAEVGLRGEVAFIETAEAVGLRHVAERAPLRASSQGVADLLAATADCAHRVVGLGGSATVDGGLGLLVALGLLPLDSAGRPVHGPPAAVLGAVRRLEGDAALPGATVLADVRTPAREAALRFGRQKGLAGEALAPHQAALDRFSEVLCAWASARGRPLSPDLEGGGAAGGLGLALAALGAPLRAGAAWVADDTGLDAALATAQAVVVGEGRLDPTSLEGKVAGEVLRRAAPLGVPALALVGQAQPVAAALVHVEEVGGLRDDLLVQAVDRLARALDSVLRRSPA